MPNGFGGGIDQCGTIVDRVDFHSLGKKADVECMDLFTESFQGWQRLFAALEEYSTLHNVAFAIPADTAQRRLMAFSDVCNVAKINRNAIVLCDENRSHLL